MKKFLEYFFTLFFIGLVIFSVLQVRGHNGRSLSFTTKETALCFHLDPKKKLFTWDNEVYRVSKIRRKYTVKEGRVFRFSYDSVTVSMWETSRTVIVTKENKSITYK